MPGKGDSPIVWNKLALSGRLTINEAQERREELLHALTNSDHLELDLAAIEAVDGAGLQLLIACHISARRDGKGLRLVPPLGEPLRAALTMAGFINRGSGRRGGAKDDFWYVEG